MNRAKQMVKTNYHVNVQPHSGSNANFAVYQGLLKKGDKILSMSLHDGGHLSHGSKANFSGNFYQIKNYGVNSKTHEIDYNRLEIIANEFKPQLIIAGASSYPKKIDFKIIGEIAKRVGAYYLTDISHIIGLIIAGLHSSPFGIADVVTSSTQKTLRGPRGGIIFCKKELANKIDRGVFPGTLGDPHMNTIAAKAVSFNEALTNDFIEYQKQIIINSKELADELIKLGFELISNGTENHLSVIDLCSENVLGSDAQNILEKCGISSNMNVVPNDTNSPLTPSGLRVGTPAITTMGFKKDNMKTIASFIRRSIDSRNDNSEMARIKNEIKELTKEMCIKNKLL